jgi:ABC-2 type transport system permease protein
VSRIGWAAGHLVFAVVGPAIALAAAATTAALVHGSDGDLPRLISAALVQLPAIWVLGGTAVALFGFAPRQARASWGLIVGCLLLGQLGRLLQLPGWLMDLSPFTHLPGPGEAARAAPLLVLVAVAAGLATAGLIGLRRRDLG